MHIATNSRLWPFSASTWQKRVIDDADRLSAEFGSGAYAVAADRCWREDVGLIKTRHPGHWARVTLEIGRRDALTEGTRPKVQGVSDKTLVPYWACSPN